jgi:hypothetical protein
MAAFVGSPTSSIQYAASTSPSRASGAETQGEVRLARFSYTHAAGSGTGEINLVKLPPGRLCIFTQLSRLYTSAMGANADVHLGYRPHRKEDGIPVDQNETAFVADMDTAGGIDTTLGFPTSGILELESQQGVSIYAMVDTGNIENGDTIMGWVTYSRI